MRLHAIILHNLRKDAFGCYSEGLTWPTESRECGNIAWLSGRLKMATPIAVPEPPVIRSERCHIRFYGPRQAALCAHIAGTCRCVWIKSRHYTKNGFTIPESCAWTAPVCVHQSGLLSGCFEFVLRFKEQVHGVAR